MIRRPPIPPLFPYTTLSQSEASRRPPAEDQPQDEVLMNLEERAMPLRSAGIRRALGGGIAYPLLAALLLAVILVDRKSTRLNSSHSQISYAVFCLKKKKQH